MTIIQKIYLLAFTAALPLIPRLGRGMDVDIEYINPVGGHYLPYATLVLRGEIMPGDYDRLIKFVTTNNIDLFTMPITLATPGGDISEALKIGGLFKSIYAEVTVGPGTGPCASACFILFASAVQRTALQGLVGIHRPYVSKSRLERLSPSEAEQLETKALLEAEDYLHRLRVPSAIIDTMFQNASSEIHWLTHDELRALGYRPAWYEEFLIARCNLNKKEEDELLDGLQDDNIHSKMREVHRCGLRLTQQEAIHNLAAATTTYYQNISAEELAREKRVNSSNEATYQLLDRDVPGWKLINTSAGFLSWIDDADKSDATAISTRTTLRMAFANHQRAVVAAIFKEYVNQHGATFPVYSPLPQPTPTPASSGRWVRFANVTDISGDLTTQGTFDLDRESLKKGDGSTFSFDVQQITTNNGPVPQLRIQVSLVHWNLNCVARSYTPFGGTSAYKDGSNWIPSPYEGSGQPILASSHPRSAQLVNGACAALTEQ